MSVCSCSLWPCSLSRTGWFVVKFSVILVPPVQPCFCCICRVRSVRFISIPCDGLRRPDLRLAFCSRSLSSDQIANRRVLIHCRYQRLSPDCLPLANGGGGGSGSVTRKPASRSCKDDDGGMAVAADSSRLSSYLPSSQLDSKPLRARAPQPLSSSAAAWSPARDHAHAHHNQIGRAHV